MDGRSTETDSTKTRLEIVEALREPFPRDLHETQQGFTYVAAEFWIERLIQITDNQYDFSIHDRWSAEIPGTWKDGKQLPPTIVFNVHGRVCIPGLGCRDDIGVQPVQPGMNDAWKGAVSDCIKRCLKNFGMGLELWKGGFKANQIQASNGNGHAQPPQNVTNLQRQPPQPQQQQGVQSIPPMTAAQRGKLAVELRNNGIDPEKVFHTFKTDNDGTAITKPLATAWIDQLVKGMVPQRLGEFMGTFVGAAGPAPVAESPIDFASTRGRRITEDPVPPGSEWTAEALNLNLAKEAQKALWHAGVKELFERPEYDEEQWFKRVVGAVRACVLDSTDNQTWRFSTIASYAPTLQVLEYIENQADQVSAVTQGLMQRLGQRAEAIAQDAPATV